MAGNEKTEVKIEKATFGTVWDEKKAKPALELAAGGVEEAVKKDCKVVSGKPDKGFILKVTVDLDLDEKKGELSGKVKVVVMDQGGSIKASLSKGGKLKDVTDDTLDKRIDKLIGAAGKSVGKDAADEIASLAKGK